MSDELLKKYLKSMPLFRNVSEKLIDEVCLLFYIVSYEKNTIVIRQGEFADKFYLVLKGKLEASIIDNKKSKQLLNIIEDGDYFGEIALLGNGIRSATVKTKENCILGVVNRTQFAQLIEDHPDVARELLIKISHRLYQSVAILSGQNKQSIILLNYASKSELTVDKFIDYFLKIASKKVALMRVEEFLKKSPEMNQEAEYQFYLLKNDLNTNAAKDFLISYKPNYTINFENEAEGELYLPDDLPLIQRLVRKINHKTIGLALSSGGAPAMAHIGVLNEFQSANIPLDFIVGTSAGALYGVNFAFGYTYDKLLEMFNREINKPKLLTLMSHFSFSFSGLAKISHLKKLIHPIFNDSNLEESIIPVATVASDLIAGTTLVIKSGNTVNAILASNAAPVFYKPFLYQNKLLIDGVATEPLPVSMLIDEKIDFKIAVSIPQLDLATSRSFKPNMTSIYIRSRSLMANQLVSYADSLADLVIKPNVADRRLFDWKNMKTYIESGALAGRDAIPIIKKYLYGSEYGKEQE